MTERKNAQPWEHRKPMAQTKLFFREKIRRSKHESEDMMLSTIYAHYRKWAFLRDESPYSRDNFERDLRRALKIEPEEFRGELLFACFVREVEVEAEVEAAKTRHVQDRVLHSIRGRVRAISDIRFADKTVSAGTVLDWLDPTANERHDLKELRKSSLSGRDGDHLVVMFAGTRRTIAASLVEMMP